MFATSEVCPMMNVYASVFLAIDVVLVAPKPPGQLLCTMKKLRNGTRWPKELRRAYIMNYVNHYKYQTCNTQVSNNVEPTKWNQQIREERKTYICFFWTTLLTTREQAISKQHASKFRPKSVTSLPEQVWSRCIHIKEPELISQGRA